jgi:metal-responsive CopG/Arc/MetJ family transcriptional regulator
MGPRGRPRKSEVMETLAVRLPDDLVDQLDEYVDLIKGDFPLLNVTRADAVRQLLAAGIEAEKSRLARRKK